MGPRLGGSSDGTDSPPPPGTQDTRVVGDVYKVCRDNQQRMKVDPFEVMLMRMGFNVARNGEDDSGDRGQGGAGGVGQSWIQDPASCRQS